MAAQIPTAEDIRAIVREEIRDALRNAGPDVLSTEQADALAGVTAKTVRFWTETGKLPAGGAVTAPDNTEASALQCLSSRLAGVARDSTHALNGPWLRPGRLAGAPGPRGVPCGS
jgi:hypothetical protein